MKRIGHTDGDGSRFTLEYLENEIEKLEALGFRGTEGKKRLAKLYAYKEVIQLIKGFKSYKNYTRSSEVKFHTATLKMPFSDETKKMMRAIYSNTINAYFRTNKDMKQFRRYNMYFDSDAVVVGARLSFNVVDNTINPAKTIKVGIITKHTASGIEVKLTNGKTVHLTNDMDFRTFRAEPNSGLGKYNNVTAL